jgi:hypothetical protein|tara:strand:+ start:826 stop:1083 length:258 start_codon:yes stop_codon:yes gene_type:complete
MIITITNDEGITSYDVNNIKDDSARTNATVMVQKVGQLEVILEALSFASSTHRGNLETLLSDNPEAVVVESEEEIDNEETSEEED